MPRLATRLRGPGQRTVHPTSRWARDVGNPTMESVLATPLSDRSRLCGSGRRGEWAPAPRMIAGCASRREKREGYVAEMADHQEMRVGPLLHSRGELLTRMARA